MFLVQKSYENKIKEIEKELSEKDNHYEQVVELP